MISSDIPPSLHPLVGRVRDAMPDSTVAELQTLLLNPDPAALGEAIQGAADVPGDGEHALITMGELLRVVDWAAVTEVDRLLFSNPDLWPPAVAPVVGWVHNPDEGVEAGPRLIEGLASLLVLRLLIAAVMPGADWNRLLIRCRCRCFSAPIQRSGGMRSPPPAETHPGSEKAPLPGLSAAAQLLNPSQRRTTP